MKKYGIFVMAAMLTISLSITAQNAPENQNQNGRQAPQREQMTTQQLLKIWPNNLILQLNKLRKCRLSTKNRMPKEHNNAKNSEKTVRICSKCEMLNVNK